MVLTLVMNELLEVVVTADVVEVGAPRVIVPFPLVTAISRVPVPRPAALMITFLRFALGVTSVVTCVLET